MKKILVLLFSLFFVAAAHAAVGEITFEDLTLGNESYWNGSDDSGGFASGGAQLNNAYEASWGSWSGFGYSNRTDTTLTGQAGQYNAITGSGGQGSLIYGVAYVGDPMWGGVIPTITFPTEQRVTGFFVTNNDYAHDSMKNGDAFAKKFEEGDWFRLTVEGKDAGGSSVGTISTLLADGTNILNTWKWVDLTGLGQVKSLEFTLTSSDTGEWGMNTPAYFCIDNINPSEPIPTLSEWGMIIFIILLCGMTLWMMRRQKTMMAS